jgi:hypothetical protein
MLGSIMVVIVQCDCRLYFSLAKLLNSVDNDTKANCTIVKTEGQKIVVYDLRVLNKEY